MCAAGPVAGALGLYCVIAYAVASERVRSGFAWRRARSRDVLRLALKQGMLTVQLGVDVGLPLALGLLLMKTLLFGVKRPIR